MKLAVLALAAISFAAVLSSCGGDGNDDGGPRVHVVAEADLSYLSSDAEIDDAFKDVTDVLERRLKAFGISDAEVIREGHNRIAVDMPQRYLNVARHLVKTGRLEFRKPVLDQSGNIVCETNVGSTYTVTTQDVPQFVEDRRDNRMFCAFDEDRTLGFVKWESATGINSQGNEQALTGSSLTNAKLVDNPTPVVLIEFDSEGRLLFEQITSELSLGQLPLAIFLDEELIGAPTVMQPIRGGETVISGLDLDEARRLAILLNSGALPLPFRFIIAGLTPQPAIY